MPTLSTLIALAEEGEALGFPPVSVEKVRRIADQSISSLEVMKRAGVKMGFGTDLLGAQHVLQSTEFTLRARVLPNIDILRSACSINADLLRQSGKLGCVQPGALADLLVVNGNTLEDISLLARPEEGIALIMRDGQFYRPSI